MGVKQVEFEEQVRDIMVSLGMQDTLAYRQTSIEREAKLLPDCKADETLRYVKLANPISPERTVMRRSALATMLELLERNGRLAESLAFLKSDPSFCLWKDNCCRMSQNGLPSACGGARRTWRPGAETKAELLISLI